MSDRCDFYFRQRVTEAELDLAFELLEQADRNLASDIGLFGIVSGAVPAPHEPVADLTIDLTAPLRAYDRLGQRIAFGTGQRVSVALDHTGVPTDVHSAGNERWLGVFLRFDRLLSDPRTDGHSARVFFRRDESFSIVVRQAPEAPAGSAPRVPLEDDELLVCDVRRRPGADQIIAADLDVSRRQAFVFAEGASIGVAAALWSVLSSTSTTVQQALDDVDGVLAAHGAGTVLRHRSTHVEHAAHGPLTAPTIGGALDELVDKLATTTPFGAGTTLVGGRAASGAPHSMAAGTAASQLEHLLGLFNSHVSIPTGAHDATAIAFTTGSGSLGATDASAAILEVLTAYAQGHFRGNQSNPGQHRVLMQPVLGTGRVMIFESRGTGSVFARMYLDGGGFWLTLNSAWNGSAWVRDSAGGAVALNLSRTAFSIMEDSTAAPSFNFHQKWWTLPIGTPGTNASFERIGPTQEIGHLSLHATNVASTPQSVDMATSVTFRSRLGGAPSSITFQLLQTFGGFTGTPTVLRSDRDGAVFRSIQTPAAGATSGWHGTYIAIA